MDKIVREISDLYELSLSIGAGLDAYANCDQFLSVLLARLNLGYGAVWVAERTFPKQDRSFRLLCARPSCKAVNVKVPPGHAVLEALEDNPVQTWPAETAPFPAFLADNHLDKGHIALFLLNPNAFLVLQSASALSLSDRTLRMLRPVLRKFGFALEGCLAHENLRKETRQRRKAQEEAEAARRAQQQFLANVSHEIRTPMNAIMGMLHLLRDTKLDSHQKEYTDVMGFASDNLMDLINNILDASKIEAGEIVLDQKAFNLHGLLSGLHNSWRLRAKGKPVQVVYKHDLSGDFYFKGDPLRLQQVVNNLLNNAYKFTESGTIRLSAQTVRQYESRADLRITVSDTGPGIKEEYLPFIFDQFKQGRKGIGQGKAGTGLGLSIVRELVALMDGVISVRNKPGSGAEFTIDLTLPIEKSDTEPETIEEPEKEITLAGVRVLVAEDNLMNQKLVDRILGKFGCKVDMVPNGLEAVRRSAQKPYDIILMDIHMPKMDGLEATKRIRVTGKNTKTPIVALSAAALLEEQNQGLASGMNDFVTKPFSPDLLEGIMLKWLADSTPQVEDDTAPPTEESSAEQVDLSYLHAICGGDEAFIEDMITTFLREIPEMIWGLESSLEARESAEVYSIAHKFKPNLGMLGLKQQEQVCADIKRMTKEKPADWIAIEQSSKRMLHAVRKVQQSLERRYSKMPEER